MSEQAERSGLEGTTDRFLVERLSPVWKRLGPLSTGAVGSAVIVVAGTELVRRLVRLRKRRNLGLWGALALMPLLARMLIGREAGDTDTEGVEDMEAVEPTGSAAETGDAASGDEE